MKTEYILDSFLRTLFMFVSVFGKMLSDRTCQQMKIQHSRPMVNRIYLSHPLPPTPTPTPPEPPSLSGVP